MVHTLFSNESEMGEHSMSSDQLVGDDVQELNYTGPPFTSWAVRVVQYTTFDRYSVPHVP